MKKLMIAAAAVVLAAALTACTDAQAGYETQLELGSKYLMELNYDDAVLAFSSVIDIDPKQTDGYIQLARLYMDMGDFDKAREILDLAKENIGDDNQQINDLYNELDARQNQSGETEKDDTDGAYAFDENGNVTADSSESVELVAGDFIDNSLIIVGPDGMLKDINTITDSDSGDDTSSDSSVDTSSDSSEAVSDLVIGEVIVNDAAVVGPGGTLGDFVADFNPDGSTDSSSVDSGSQDVAAGEIENSGLVAIVPGVSFEMIGGDTSAQQDITFETAGDISQDGQ